MLPRMQRIAPGAIGVSLVMLVVGACHRDRTLDHVDGSDAASPGTGGTHPGGAGGAGMGGAGAGATGGSVGAGGSAGSDAGTASADASTPDAAADADRLDVPVDHADADANADADASDGPDADDALPPPKGLALAAEVRYMATTPQVVAIGDLNKDGKPDVVTTSFNGSVSVLLGNGDGTLKAQKVYGSNAPTPGTGIVIDDFNGDGNPDVAVAFSRYGFGTFLGQGDGTLGNFIFGVSGSVEGPIAAADFDKDGKKDVVLPINSAGGVDVISGKGDGTFQQSPPLYESGPYPLGVVIADFDRDGTLDIATAGGGAVGVLLGKNDGTFPLTGMTFPVGSGPVIHSMAAGDFNGDGVLDVVAPDSGGVTVNVLLGKGDGTLLAAQQFPCGANPFGVALADLDLDGKLDIIQTTDLSAAGSVGVLLGRGDGTFSSAVAFPTGLNPRAVAVADFDGDGRPDLAVANTGQDSVSILLNRSH